MNKNPNYYAVIPANVRYCDKLKPNAKLLYGELTALTNKEGYCWASNQYFADLYNVGASAVSRWFSQLKKYGFIKVEIINNKGHYDRKVWIVEQAAPLCKKRKGPVQKAQGALGKNAQTPVQKAQHNNTGSTTINITNNTRPQKGSEKRACFGSDFEELWAFYPRKEAKKAAFEKYKARRKAGVSHEDLKKAVINYARIKHGTEIRYIMQGSRFFGHKEEYLDFIDPIDLSQKVPKSKIENLEELKKKKKQQELEKKAWDQIPNLTPEEEEELKHVFGG